MEQATSLDQTPAAGQKLPALPAVLTQIVTIKPAADLPIRVTA